VPVLVLLAIGMGGPPSEAPWIVSAYVGTVHTESAGIQIDQPATGTSLFFPNVSFRSVSWDSPIYYGYRVAHRVPRARALYVEAELIHAKIFAETAESASGSGTRNGIAVGTVPFSSVVQRFAMSHGLNFVFINALVRHPLAADRVMLTGRVGAGPLLPHAEIEIEHRTTEGYQLSGAGVQASAGIEMRVWRHANVLAEYKWTRARPAVEIDDGRATVTTRSHHVVMGLSLDF